MVRFTVKQQFFYNSFPPDNWYVVGTMTTVSNVVVTFLHIEKKQQPQPSQYSV